MASNTLLPKNVQVPNLKFSKVYQNKSGGKSIYINYLGDRLTLQTPLMRTPFGVSDWSNAEGNEGQPKKYDLNLSFVGMDDNARIKVFLDKMLELEEFVLDAAHNGSKEADPVKKWFPKTYTKEVLREFFTPIVRFGKDKNGQEMPPTMKFKIPYDAATDAFTLESYDLEGTIVEFKDIKDKLRGGKAQLVAELTGIWFVGNKFGCMWKVMMGRFDAIANRERKVAFVQDDDEEEASSNVEEIEPDTEVAAVSPKKAAVKAVKPPPTYVEDSDEEVVEEEEEVAAPEEEDAEDAEEEEVLEEEEDEPTPPPPPPKKVVKKAATKAAK